MSDIQPKLEDVGGKAANLIALTQLENISLPEGFCVSTRIFSELFNQNEDFTNKLKELNNLSSIDCEKISTISNIIRNTIMDTTIPDAIIRDIHKCVKKIGEAKAYAVRSSATAEDLPFASFAGQHDSYLNVVEFENIITHIKKCWASLYTDRAVTYRIQNSIHHEDVTLAVVVQQMISSEYSGVMFTADPISSDRNVVSIDACYGLGDSYVSGYTNADNYKVVDGTIISKDITNKSFGAYPNGTGKIRETAKEDHLKKEQVLSDSQIIELEHLGRQIESHFSSPQDIEWCIAENQIYVLQSRPITTLFPLPKRIENETRIYVSSGHLQMMTAPVKPLGMYFFKSVISNPPSIEIGGRLYLDISNDLSSFFGRMIAKSLFGVLGDDLLTTAVKKISNDKEVMKQIPKGKEKVFKIDNNSGAISILVHAYKAYKKADSNIVKDIIRQEEEDIKKMEKELSLLSGDSVFEYIHNDHENRRVKLMKPMNAGVITAAMLSIRSFDKKIKKWLGENNAADNIIISVPNSITTKTGFELMDVADKIREYPDIIRYLNHPDENTFFEDLGKLDGGNDFCDAFKEYLFEYGMRCSGDIDITAERWIENPLNIVPIILSNIDNFEPNAATHKHNLGVAQSEQRVDELLSKLRKLPRGKRKAKKIEKLARVIRNYVGYREYPKFSYMKRYYIYKQAMLKEADKLVKTGILTEKKDIYFLKFEELRTIANGQELDKNIIVTRRLEYERYEKLTPPRVLTSNGDVIIGEYDSANLPENALQGIPVSAGVVEGRARVVKHFQDSILTERDILVTEYTDPSWTPVFVTIKGLITEVGGLTTHGAIIAREYGLPAVVSVKNATRLIKDGQLIRLHGTEGYIEILSDESN